ncbi:MAG: M48 family metalloprotease [Magnetococcus sp. DMHC-6]
MDIGRGPSGFFDRQANARRRSLLLMVYFPLAVAFVLLSLNGIYFLYTIFSLEWIFADNPLTSPYRASRWYLINGIGITLILGGTLYRVWQLAKGGAQVARILGAVAVHPASQEPDQRRLIHVVEEMAIASQVARPAIYLLKEQRSLNAMVAGQGAEDAALLITQGCLDLLTRDELQGVVAHEMAHILNGDMRLNTRIMGLLFGIQMIAILGKVMAEGATNQSMNPGTKSSEISLALPFQIIFGFILWFFGYIGLFFSQIIQGAVSRQREHLADAYAVQFTRHPLALAQALMKIGGFSSGSFIYLAHSDEAGHMFFCPIYRRRFTPWTATHPPLDMRIRLLDPTFNGHYPKLVGDKWYGFKAYPQGQEIQEVEVKKTPLLELALRHSPLLQEIAPPLLKAAHDTHSALMLIYALLLDMDPEQRQAQYQWLTQEEKDDCLEEINQLAQHLHTTSPESRLALVDLTAHALNSTSQERKQRIRRVVEGLVRMDHKVTLFEYALQKLLDRHLDPTIFHKPLPTRRLYSFRKMASPLSILCSAMAHLGGGTAENRMQAILSASTRLGSPELLTLISKQEVHLQAVDTALNELLNLGDEFRLTVIDALTECALTSKNHSSTQMLLMRAVCAVLNIPFPRRMLEKFC